MSKRRKTHQRREFPYLPGYDAGSSVSLRFKSGKRSRTVRTAAAIAIPLIFIIAGYLLIRLGSPPAKTKVEGDLAAGAPPDSDVSSASEPGPRIVDQAILPGETLSDILKDHDLSPAEIDRLVRQVKSVFNLAKIIAGRTIRLAFDPGGSLQKIEYPLGGDQFLLIAKEGPEYRAEKKTYPFVVRPVYIDGVIDEHLYGAILAAGEEAGLAVAIEQIFSWDIDFYAGLRPGDCFRLIVEKKFLDGRFRRYGNILAAEFWNDGRRIDAFRFEYEEGGKTNGGHFHADGRSLRKEFLKSPLLDRYRITSRFTSRRLHPIRKVYRAHYGVDYAAPVGTPVYATADGKVEAAGLNGGAGRMIRLSHKNGYETMYLHLSEINVRVGQRVTGGERIGKVGTSGESTGPHLDYRIKRFGSYLNPLSAKFMPVEPLPKKWMPDFQKNAEGFRNLLEAPLIAISLLF